MNKKHISFCVLLYLIVFLFSKISFGQELDQENFEGIVKISYSKNTEFEIESKKKKGTEFKFSGYQTFSIDKKDLLNVLLDLNSFCEKGSNCLYVTPGMVTNKIVTCNESNKNIPLYTWSLIHTFIDDSFYSRFNVIEEESKIVVNISTPTRNIIDSLVEKSGYTHSTNFDFATTTWTLTPVEGNPSLVKAEVSAVIQSTSWLISLFAERVSAALKESAELTFKHLEYGGSRRLSHESCSEESRP